MAENRHFSDFTVYLEGHEGHRGNVLVHAFLAKVHRLTLVLNKLERTYIESGTRQTDFEITAADKRNPTTLTLKPVPRVRAYDPDPAFHWALAQISAVSRGEQPDDRVRGEIARDLVKLATKEADDGYKAFWINGHAEAVRFDEDFLAKAALLVRDRARIESPSRWHVGASLGSIVGQLKAVDDIDDDREFVIVPPTGAEAITCTFPAAMRGEMGGYLFKTVKVEGILHYGEDSPFPYRVDAKAGGINVYPSRARRRTLDDLRGVFSDLPRNETDWTPLLDA
ncbi:hypothetical protein O4H52_10410 [Sphingomonadaceae bacterium G21617-S1]|nr:hypothetical protein [Sphingomonadaceae bacterium G21617-S1]